MDSSSSSVPPAATGPSPCEALPLLNRLADFCVVYGVDHLSFVRNNESRNRFSSLHKWVQAEKPADETDFRLEPQLLGVIAPRAGYFPYEANALGDYPYLEALEDFKEKQIGLSRDRVFTLQHVIFPDGAHVCLESPSPLVISARLTDYEANKTYCTSLTFYRKYRLTLTHLTPWTAAAAADKDNDPCVFAPVSITLVSQTPRYRTQSELLTCVFEHLCPDPFNEFWVKIADFAQRVFVVPTPPPGALRICFNMYGEHAWTLNPYHPSAPHGSSSELDIRLHYPFLCLSPENVLKVVAAILTEKRIIFSSSHYTMLTFVIECLFHYISPLEWRYTVITTVASSLLELVEYFGVYLYGIHSQLLSDPLVKAVQDVVWVDLDKGTVVGDLADAQALPNIPREAAEGFLDRYRSIQKNFDVLMTERPSFLRKEELVTAWTTFEAEYDQQLSNAFLDLMVDLLGNMFIFRVGGGTDIKLWKEFSTKSVTDRLFYEEVWKGDMWSNLIYQRGPKTVRDMFTIKVEAIKKSASRQSSTDTLQSLRARGSLFSPSSEDLPTPPPDQTELSCVPRITSLLSSSSWSGSSLQASLSKTATGQVLCLPDYRPQRAEYFAMVVDAIATLLENEQLPDAVLAPLFYLEGCYRVTCRQLTQALDCFYKTDKYMVAVGLKPSKQMLKFVVEKMSKREKTEFAEKPYFYECQKSIEDQQGYPRGAETPIEARQKLPKEPISVEGLTSLLKKHNITRDTDTAFKLFNVLSKHHSVIQPEVFREFYDNWKNHMESIKCFQLPPDLKLETKGHRPERVLMTCDQNCFTSAGNGQLVLTTFRLLAVLKGGTRTQCLLDLREPVMLEKFDQRYLFTSHPAITQRAVEDKPPGGKKPTKPEWFAGFPKSYLRDIWYRMLKELMFAITECGKRKSPEKISLAETSILVTNAVLCCSQFQSQQHEEHRVNRTISKLQHFANKDVSEFKPAKPVQGLQYTLNPSLDEPRGRQTIECALYVPPAAGEEGQGKLWLGLGNGLLKVYDLETRSPESDVKVVDSYHRKAPRLSCMLLVGDCVWACSLNKTIHILSAETCCVNHRLSHLEDDICDLTLDGDNNIVWSLLLIQCKVIAWNPVTREPIKKIEVQSGIQCKCLVAHKDQLWIGTKNGLYVVDREDGRELAHISGEKQTLDVKFLAISSQQEIWCGTEPSREVRPLFVYDPNRFSKKHEFSDLSEWVNVILATGRQIWCGTKSGKIYIMDAESYAQNAVLDAHTDRVRTMISAGGVVISGSASKDGTAAIWEANRNWTDS